MSAFLCDHDYHVHTSLSTCCADPAMSARGIAEYAVRAGYSGVCYTDHLWDGDVPGVSEWYAPQDLPHVKRLLPLPTGLPLALRFGCEVEYMGGDRLTLTRPHFDEFDLVSVPLTHMHSKGYVRPLSVVTERQMASLLTERLEQLAALDLPFEKIGLSHLTDPSLFFEGCVADVMALLDEERFLRAMDKYAARGTGVELNASAFPAWQARPEDWLRPYRLAKKAGCKFYCGSDAHHPDALPGVTTALPAVAEALGLTDTDRYQIPTRR